MVRRYLVAMDCFYRRQDLEMLEVHGSPFCGGLLLPSSGLEDSGSSLQFPVVDWFCSIQQCEPSLVVIAKI